MSEASALSRRDLLRLVAEEACRDGVLEEREKRLLEVLVEFLKIERGEAQAVVAEARQRHREGALGAPRNLDERALYRAVLDAVHADGRMDRVEAKMLEAVRRLLGIAPKVHRALFDELRLAERPRAAQPVEEPAPAPEPAPLAPDPAEEHAALLREIHEVVERVAGLSPTLLGLPEQKQVEEELRHRCLSLWPKLQRAALPSGPMVSACGGLFRAMARLGCPIDVSRAVGVRARKAGDALADADGDGDRVQRLVATAWLARAANRDEAGDLTGARHLLHELTGGLDDRKVLLDARQSGSGEPPPRRELVTSTGRAAFGIAILVMLMIVVPRSSRNQAMLALVLGLPAAAWLLIMDGAKVSLAGRGITRTDVFGVIEIGWHQIETVAFGFQDHHSHSRNQTRYTGTSVYIDLSARDGTKLALHGLDSTPQGGPWMRLVDEIQAFLGPRLRTRDLARFERDGAVRFGAVRFTRDAVEVRRLWGYGPFRRIAWVDLSAVDFDGVTLRLFTKREWMLGPWSCDSRRLPNIFSVLAILERHGHAAG